MIKIVCAADDNYAMPLGVMLYSLLKHLNRQSFLEIFVIDGGITQKNKTKIRQSLNFAQNQFKIHWLNPENSQLFSQIKTAKVSHHLSLATYYRLLISDLLPLDIDKIIYLDIDLLVRHDLTYLWSIDLKNYCIAAIQDMGLPYVSSRYGLAIHKELDISPETKYFNCGVMIISLTLWRQEKISEKVLDFLTKYSEKIRWHDQDALNAIFAGKWLEIDPRWNQIPYILNLKSWQDSPFSEDVYDQVIKDPYIIHYATENKPWKYRVNPRPNDNLYFEYLDQTVWKGWRPKELLSTRLKRYYQRFFAKK
jgi:lipopolysaccharide biosynthesis glycosyltransferase